MKKSTILILVFILALGVFFRFFLITEIPLGLYPDEAMNGNNALEALETSDFKIFYPENNGREGFFINIQALSLAIFGNEPWALRVVSAIFGALTILGVFLLTRELFRSNSGASDVRRKDNIRTSEAKTPDVWRPDVVISLLSAFFLATSFWHINFSRIGFRAILVPMLATFGIYFLLKGLRKGKILDLVWAGILIGLGFHTYIAFRFMPLVLLVPLIGYWWQWRGQKNSAVSKTPWEENIPDEKPEQKQRQSKFAGCAPCAIALFLLVVLVVALPIGIYFIQNPGDFLGRSGQVSIFTAESPIKEIVKSKLQTFGMFFVRGDCNWRHNFDCQPELHPFVAIAFLVGLIVVIRGLFIRNSELVIRNLFLLLWIAFMSLPAVLTREGLPHALRSIGMLPPIMILAGLGAFHILRLPLGWFEKKKLNFLNYKQQLSRIQREVAILFIFLLLLIPLVTYRKYFLEWANHSETYYSFATDTLHIGEFLNKLPASAKKYVVVNTDGVLVRGIPMPAQTIMFVTDTFSEEKQAEKNIIYLLPSEISRMVSEPDVIAFVNSDDRELIHRVNEKFPNLNLQVPGDFTILVKEP